MRLPAERAPSWLFLDELARDRFSLPDEEAHYVARVCRAHVGDRVTAADGCGTVAELELVKVAHDVEVRVLSRTHVPRPFESWILCGAPEGTRSDWLVEKLAELGVAKLMPLDVARAVWRGVRRERLQKIAVAALRQSRRAWRLEIDPPHSLVEAIGLLPTDAERWRASAEAQAGPIGGTPAGISVAAIGPAQGFDERERDLLDRSGFRPIRLAEGRLRCETAAVAWASGWAGRVPSAGVPGPGR